VLSRPQVPELLSALIESASDAVFLVDPETDRFIDVNPGALRLTGFSRPDLLGKTPASMFRLHSSELGENPARTRDTNWLRQAFEQNRFAPAQFEGAVRTSGESTWLPVHVTFTRLPFEPRLLGLISASDPHVTGQTPLDPEDELRQVLNAHPDPVWSTEREPIDTSYLEGWRYRHLSPEIVRLIGRPSEYLHSDPSRWYELVHPDDRTGMLFHLERFLYSTRSLLEQEYRVL